MRWFIFLLGGFLLMFTPLLAQDYKKIRREINTKQENTRSEIKTLNKQIKSFQERLNKTEERYEELYNQTKDLKNVIALQNEKIEKLQEEKSQINQEIEVTEQAIEKYEYELKHLIESYKQSLSYLYKHGRDSELALILTSKSLNQMLIRSFYLSKFEKRRDRQARKIKETQNQLVETKKQLLDAREKKASVLNEIRKEKRNHARRKEKLEENIAILKQNEKKIRNKLEKVRKQKEQLNNTLTKLIKEERELRRKQEQAIAEAKRSGSEVSSRFEKASFVSSERLERIESSFEKQKGELPWPVKNGVITEKFGLRRDPVLGTETMNLGIDIATEPRTPVHAVYDGYVFAVRPLPGYGDLVFVNHGRFKTVYGNLSKVNVRKNTYLEKGDVVGMSGIEESPKGETVFFMMRENSRDLNPEKWLSNK